MLDDEDEEFERMDFFRKLNSLFSFGSYDKDANSMFYVLN